MITAIVAHDDEFGIGKNGRIPWICPEDLKFFKKITENNTVVMGRKTWESLPRSLPNRNNIVLTNDKFYVAPGAQVCNEIYFSNDNENIFIIGGSSIYDLYDEYIERWYITRIFGKHNCDTFLNFNESAWKVKSVGILAKNTEVTIYERK